LVESPWSPFITSDQETDRLPIVRSPELARSSSSGGSSGEATRNVDRLNCTNLRHVTLVFGRYQEDVRPYSFIRRQCAHPDHPAGIRTLLTYSQLSLLPLAERKTSSILPVCGLMRGEGSAVPLSGAMEWRLTVPWVSVNAGSGWAAQRAAEPLPRTSQPSFKLIDGKGACGPESQAAP